MTPSSRAAAQLDLRALEARTQTIGHELLAEAKREHAHLSALNRWTAQVLSWCLSDPSVKSAVLQFIDVLPSLETPREIADHVRSYFPTSKLRLPAALRVGSSLARSGLLTQGALASVIRPSIEHVARQFIAESHTEGVGRVIQALLARGSTCSLDVLGEQVLSEQEADVYVQQCATLLRDSAAAYTELPAITQLPLCSPPVNLSIKPSALTPRFDPISPIQSIQRAAARLEPLLPLASACSAVLNLDMEQYELRDLTLELAKSLLVHASEGVKAGLGVVIQSYLRDSESIVEDLLMWLETHERALTIRLVKGAYWDYEVAQAAQCVWPVPVCQDKAATDAAFERLTRRLLSAYPLVTTAIASHNVRSIAHAMAVAEALGLSKRQLEFQLLYGMGEAIQAAIVARGYPVRIYTPIGELIPGMAYLVRRILENTSNESFLRQDLFQERSAEELLRPPTPRDAPATSGVTTPPLAWQREPFLDFSKSSVRVQMERALISVKQHRPQHHALLIGADAVTTPDMFTVRNPAAPTEVVGTVSKARLVDVDRAVHLASSTQPEWARTPVSERAACLRRAARLMHERRCELAALEVLEVGKTWREADVDVLEAIESLEYYSQQMLELAKGRVLLQVPGERNLLRYVPRGVAVIIAPWNFPAAILTGMTSAALVSGNTAIVKPAEESSIIAAQIIQILRDAGVPSSAIQFLPGIGEEVGAALVQRPDTHAILFTGSKAVGLSIIEVCARVQQGQRVIKHVVAEMGGKNAIIVDADADLDAVIQGVLRSAFGYSGQKCSAASRLIVHQRVYDRLLSRLSSAVDRLVLGDPADSSTDIGPLISESAQQRLLGAIAHAREVSTVTYSYPHHRIPPHGYFVGPTLVTDVSPQDSLAKDELFGPLLCIFRVKTFEEALGLANESDFALTGGVYSRSPGHIEYAMQAFDVGNLYINRPITGAMIGRQPFGGHRLSGLGTKAGGPDYLLQLMIPKTICTNTTRHGMPLD